MSLLNLSEWLKKANETFRLIGNNSKKVNETLNNKVDKEAGKGLSEQNFTKQEKDKLKSLSNKYLGNYASFEALCAAYPETETNAQKWNPSKEGGFYADVDEGKGKKVSRYIWDTNDFAWTKQAGTSAALTASQIKEMYESNANTNAFTDKEKQTVNTVEKEIENLKNVRIGTRNLLYAGKCEKEKLFGSIADNGSVSTSTDTIYTDFIEVKDYKKVTVKVWEKPLTGYASLAYYDKDKKFIKKVDFNGNTYIESTVDIPANTFYLRISTPRPLTKKGKYKVEFGDKATDYTPAPEDMEIQKQEEINIGAVNLLKNSTNYKNWSNRNAAQITDEKYLDATIYKVIRDYSAMSYQKKNIQGLKKGVDYTFSFYCKTIEDTSKMDGELYVYGATNSGSKIVDINKLTQEWQRFSITVKFDNSANNDPLFRVESRVNVTSGILFAALQLEEGNRATSYAPSYQDFVLDFQTEDPLNIYQEALK